MSLQAGRDEAAATKFTNAASISCIRWFRTPVVLARLDMYLLCCRLHILGFKVYFHLQLRCFQQHRN
jgi:hypothetical protein